MATSDELAQLQAATGPAADQLFADLMVPHHQGGIHMAEYAAQHANESEVRRFAGQIAGNQQEEINEMQQLLQASRTS